MVVQVEPETLPHTKEGVLNTCVSIPPSNFGLQTSDTLLPPNPRQPALRYSHRGTLEEYNRRERGGVFSEQWIELGVGSPFPRK